jgi:hypothetical protein
VEPSWKKRVFESGNQDELSEAPSHRFTGRKQETTDEAYSRGDFKVLVRDSGRMVVFNQESYNRRREDSTRADPSSE